MWVSRAAAGVTLVWSHLRVGHRHFNNGCGAGCAQGEARLKFLSAWKRPSKEFNNVCNALRTHSGIASGAAKSDKETNMTAMQ
jgi:hypothetical protein